MEDAVQESRTHLRGFVEPYDTGTYLAFAFDGKRYQFNLLDTSPEGMGMLVREDDEGILKKLRIGNQIRVEYKTPEASMDMDLEIRHITRIERGKYKGHHQVGLSLLSDLS